MFSFLLYLVYSLSSADSQEESAAKSVTQFLSSGKACSVCRSLVSDVEIFVKEELMRDVIQSSLIKKCNAMNGFAQITCKYIVKDKFDELLDSTKYGPKVCKNLKLCSKNLPQSSSLHASTSPLKLGRIPRARIAVPNAKPLKADCSLCEMLVQYSIEVHMKKAVEPFYIHFQEQCKKMPQFQSKCHIFSPEVMAMIGAHMKSQTSAFEICVYAHQC